MKVGVSYVSTADASANLQAEDPGWSLAKVEDEATASLGRRRSAGSQVGGGTPPQRADLLHRPLPLPARSQSSSATTTASTRGSTAASTTPAARTQYANFSEWDIYRSEIPLLSMIDPSAVLRHGAVAGQRRLPGRLAARWEVADADSGTMNGDSADPIIADAYAFGVRGFDARQRSPPC